MDEDQRQGPRKRKSKVPTKVVQTPDLNIPIGGGSSALVPASLVNARVSQLDDAGDSVSSMNKTLKKQKRGNSQNAGSAAAASGSPRRAQ